MAMNRAYWSLPAIRSTVFVNPENDGAFFPGTRDAADAPIQ
jgi:hypothetical protein